MGDMLVVRCSCGFEARGSADQVVATMQQHGRDLHNMDATAQQILARAQTEDE